VNIFIQLQGRYRQAENPLRSERYLELAAVVLTVVLVLFFMFSGMRLLMLSEPEARLPAPESLVVGNETRGGVLTSEMRSEIAARPVFFPSRRPQDAVPLPPKGDKSAASKSELDKVRLLGVFGGGESAGVILLVEGKKRRLIIGEAVKGWKLQAVDLNQAKFSSGGKLETLVLQYSPAKAAGNGSE
jgi:hypothetical protein